MTLTSGPQLPEGVQPSELDDAMAMSCRPTRGDGCKPAGQVRTFESGATRDSDDEKIDFEGFLSHIVLQRFAEYMHKHRKQSDGNMRASDNWQKGIPRIEYMKSKFRHFMETWSLHRFMLDDGELLPLNCIGEETLSALENSLCAEMFNTMGYLLVLLQERGRV